MITWARGNRYRRISAQLVMDLNLERFCRRLENPYVDWWLIDRRRLKRELRGVSKLKAAAAARFAAQLDELAYQRLAYGREYYWAADGRMVSRADLVRIKELVDAALVRSIEASP